MQFLTSFRIQIEVIIIYLKNKLLKVLFISKKVLYLCNNKNKNRNYENLQRQKH
jgi:hypothetical protein